MLSSKIKKYLPENYKDSFDKNIFFTILVITISMLIIEFYGWQVPFHRLAYTWQLHKNYSKNNLTF